MELINLTTHEWPITIEQFRQVHPNVLLPDAPAILERIDWSTFGHAVLQETERPVFDDVLEQLIPSLVIDGPVCTKVWTAQKRYVTSAEEVAAVQADVDRRCADFVQRINADVDVLYTRAVGNRATEYVAAEAHALAYRAAGYTGPVPPYVQDWADATGNTVRWSADDTIATAQAWRTVQGRIRAKRLECKHRARAVQDRAGFAPLAAEWAAFVAEITPQLEG